MKKSVTEAGLLSSDVQMGDSSIFLMSDNWPPQKHTCKCMRLHLIAFALKWKKSKTYQQEWKFDMGLFSLLSLWSPFSVLYFHQASIKGIFEVHLRKFLIINSAMGNNSHKFTSNALSQWSNERYFANNWSLSSYCARCTEGGKEQWLSELWHCASVSRSSWNWAPWHRS